MGRKLYVGLNALRAFVKIILGVLLLIMLKKVVAIFAGIVLIVSAAVSMVDAFSGFSDILKETEKHDFGVLNYNREKEFFNNLK